MKKLETAAEKIARLKALRLAAEANKPKVIPVGTTLLNMDDELTIGKHKGSTIEWIIDNDPSYLRWMQENIKDYAFSEIVEKELIIALEEHDAYSKWKDKT